jgi:hypothetical protein
MIMQFVCHTLEIDEPLGWVQRTTIRSLQFVVFAVPSKALCLDYVYVYTPVL